MMNSRDNAASCQWDSAEKRALLAGKRTNVGINGNRANSDVIIVHVLALYTRGLKCKLSYLNSKTMRETVNRLHRFVKTQTRIRAQEHRMRNPWPISNREFPEFRLWKPLENGQVELCCVFAEEFENLIDYGQFRIFHPLNCIL